MTEKLHADGRLWQSAIAAVRNPRNVKGMGVVFLAIGIAGLIFSSGIDTATPSATSSAAAVETLTPTANAAPDCTWPYRDTSCAGTSTTGEMRSIRLISTDKDAPSMIVTVAAPKSMARTTPVKHSGPGANVGNLHKVGLVDANPVAKPEEVTDKPMDAKITVRSRTGKTKVVGVPQEQSLDNGDVEQESPTLDRAYAAPDLRSERSKSVRRVYRGVAPPSATRSFMEMRDERTP